MSSLDFTLDSCLRQQPSTLLPMHSHEGKFMIDSGAVSISIRIEMGLAKSGSIHLSISERARKVASPMAAPKPNVSLWDLLIQKERGRIADRGRRVIWFVAVLILWGWGGASPVLAGCGDHLPLGWPSVGDHPSTLPWTGEGTLPGEPQPHAPCPGPGCSPAGPTLPPLSLAPPVIPETSKPSPAADCRIASWHGDDTTTVLNLPSIPALLQGTSPDIFHPPRLTA